MLLFMAIMGAGAAVVFAQSSMADFGLDENELKSGIVNSLTHGYLAAYPDKKLFRAASAAAQAAFVKNTMSWVQSYTETAAFKAEYEKKRQEAKPSPAKSKGSPDEQYAMFQAEQRRNIETMKKDLAKMPPEMRKQMQEAVKQMEANVDISTKDPQMAARLKESYRQNAIDEQKGYQNRLKEWETKYPADTRVLIAARLREFLELSRDIPFEAKLVSKGEVKRFADPQYEGKSSQWKQCFRAGRQPVQAARAYALNWLSQIGKK
jgi:hypothetical protein